MSTNYPTTLDVYYDKVDNVSTVLATAVNNMQDAITALEYKVGKNISMDPNSIDYMISDFFTASRGMYFYMTSAPVGWETAGMASACVIGVKANSGNWNKTIRGNYNGDGTDAGNWEYSLNYDNHYHQWQYYSAGNYGYKADGVTGTPITYAGPETAGLITQIQHGDEYRTTRSWDTFSVSHWHDTNATSESWRPKTSLGVIGEYGG